VLAKNRNINRPLRDVQSSPPERQIVPLLRKPITGIAGCCARRERPGDGRAAGKRYELADKTTAIPVPSLSIHCDIGFHAPRNNRSFSFLLSQCALRFTAATKREVQQILELGGRGDAPIQHW
jgi:hypothetical protein